MGAFGIFVFVLTGIYIVYYSVMICMDLFGKKAKSDDSTEEFDFGGQEEPAMSIIEDASENGFSAHPGVSITQEDFDGSREDAERFQPRIPDVSDGGDYEHNEESNQQEDGQAASAETAIDDDENVNLDDEEAESLAAYERLAEVKSESEAIRAEAQEVYLSADFAAEMSQPLDNVSRILKTVISQ